MKKFSVGGDSRIPTQQSSINNRISGKPSGTMVSKLIRLLIILFIHGLAGKMIFVVFALGCDDKDVINSILNIGSYIGIGIGICCLLFKNKTVDDESLVIWCIVEFLIVIDIMFLVTGMLNIIPYLFYSRSCIVNSVLPDYSSLRYKITVVMYFAIWIINIIVIEIFGENYDSIGELYDSFFQRIRL